MKKYFKQGALILIILLFTMSNSNAQKLEKSFTESFKTDKSTILEIDSKFGEVKIMTWDENSVEVNVDIWVESSREERAEELLSNLDAEVSSTDDRITVKSILPDKLNTRKDTKFRIDFTINAPPYINLELSSKYGTVFVDALGGHAHISVSYGNIKVRELSRGKEKPLNQINLAYSTGSIEEADWLKLDLSYSKISIDKATAIMAISKYSGFTLEEGSSLVIESKYDTYSMGELNNFLGEMKYGNLKIEELFKKLEIESAYSSVKVEEIGPEFELISIENSRGGYKLGIDDDASFILKGEAIRGDISITGMENLNKQVENADKYINGTYGSSPSATINLEVKEGSIKIVLD